MKELAKKINNLDTGIISSISCHKLSKLIKKFLKQYPKVQFTLYQKNYTTIPQWIRNDEVYFSFVNPKAVLNINTHFIKNGQLIAVLPSNHHLASKPYVTLDELAKEPFLLLEEGALNKPLEAFKRQNLKTQIKLSIHDDYSTLSMIEIGLVIKDKQTLPMASRVFIQFILDNIDLLS